ncbi:MAG: dTMP kinase [Anaerolineaceae bacterium]|nr:dTMP kinase [Anaerolineaceae bacterium]
MFITLEGTEGSGKSSQAGPLAECIRQKGYTVIATREPGGTAIGNQIREILLNLKNTDIQPRTEILLFQAARAQLVEQVIRPHLQQGGVVLCDRYADSTLAYQGYGQGGDLATLRLLLDFATGHLKPDLTFLLDIDVITGLERRRTSGGEWNRLDAQASAYYQRVRSGYLELAGGEPERWVIIDANRPHADVQADLRRVALQRLKDHSHSPVT